MSAVVYRVYDRAGQLLYIGSTKDFESRKAVHLATRGTPIAFAIQMCAARWETQKYPTIDDAKAAERAAITTEAPFLNRQHNPTRWTKRGGRWVSLLPEYELNWRRDETATTSDVRDMFRDLMAAFA